MEFFYQSQALLALIVLQIGYLVFAQCPTTLPTPPKYAIPTSFGTASGTVINYYCPAHFVSSFNNKYERFAGTITCVATVWVSNFKDCERK